MNLGLLPLQLADVTALAWRTPYIARIYACAGTFTPVLAQLASRLYTCTCGRHYAYAPSPLINLV
jgi:hypothetical protein